MLMRATPRRDANPDRRVGRVAPLDEHPPATLMLRDVAVTSCDDTFHDHLCKVEAHRSHVAPFPDGQRERPTEAEAFARGLEEAAERLFERGECSAAAVVLDEAGRVSAPRAESARYARAGFLAHLAGRRDLALVAVARAALRASPEDIPRIARLAVTAAPRRTHIALAPPRQNTRDHLRHEVQRQRALLLAAAAAARLVRTDADGAQTLSRLAAYVGGTRGRIAAVDVVRLAALGDASSLGTDERGSQRLLRELDPLDEDAAFVLPLLLIGPWEPTHLRAQITGWAVRARSHGAHGALASLLATRCHLEYLGGDIAAAASLGEEAVRLAPEVQRPEVAEDVEGWLVRAFVAAGAPAVRGDWPFRTGRACDASATPARRIASGHSALVGQDPERAADELGKAQLIDGPTGGPLVRLGLADQVEALVRIDQRSAARVVLASLAARVHVKGDILGLGLLHRSRGLVAEDLRPHFRAALTLLAAGGFRLEVARTHLLFGMRLRRSGLREEAHAQLAAARAAFEAMEASAFAEQAEREMLVLGLAPRASGSHGDLLTPRELQIARAALAGATSREIASRLFISEKTVERHLGVVYRKLGIRRRVELVGKLDKHEQQTRPASQRGGTR
jgi:DNA-binding CsgD family transcriptional regulator